MNILIYSFLDINGQGQMLAEWLRANTKHKVTHIISQQTYLGYPYDSLMTMQDVTDLILSGRFDFFIFRWVSSDFVYDLARSGAVHRGNTILRLHGSEVRQYPYKYNGLWNHVGLTMVSNGYDFHLNSELGFVVQHIPAMIDVAKIWNIQCAAHLPLAPFIIGHAPTDPAKKGTKYLQAAVKALFEKGRDVELRLITGKSWDDAIRQKAGCHVIFDQISQEIGIGTFGVNLLEALAQSKPVMADLHKFTYSMYPEMEQCVTPVTAATLEGDIERLMHHVSMQRSNGATYHLNEAGWKLARSRFSVDVVARQWQNMIEFVDEAFNTPAVVTK